MRQRGLMTKMQMREPSRSVQRLMRGKSQEPYHNLANAIVATAADDYRLALFEDNEELKASLEKFFRSNWFKVLTTIDPERLIRLLKNEHIGKLNSLYI